MELKAIIVFSISWIENDKWIKWIMAQWGHSYLHIDISLKYCIISGL